MENGDDIMTLKAHQKIIKSQYVCRGLTEA